MLLFADAGSYASSMTTFTPFTKMHGLGNDFVVFDAVQQKIQLSSEQVRKLADRRLGVGCDQILLVEPATDSQSDFFYRIYNADGSESGQCGNGIRCIARFVVDRGLSSKDQLVFQTISSRYETRLLSDGQVTVNMGAPVFVPAQIPFSAGQEQLVYPLDIDGETASLSVLSMGNPHAVMRVDDVARAPVATLGPAIEAHKQFPQRVNIGFMQVVDKENIRLRVYERGAGETLACGTGACAAVVAGSRQGWLAEQVTVQLSGGKLLLQWQGGDHPVWMTGPVTTVYKGQLELETL